MSDKRLQDKVCIITGSTAGIGEGIASLFAEQGGKVVISGRSEARGQAVVDKIISAGNTAIFVRCDVSDDAQIDALLERTVDEFGGLDVVVNNAADIDAAYCTGLDVENLSPALWDRQMNINLRAIYYLCHLAIPLLRQRGGGTIVNVSSVGSQVAWPAAAAYLSAKGAVNQLTRSIAVDYAQDNIRANALLPGWILTATEQERIDQDDQLVGRVKESKGIQRMGTPREMAYAALFLACSESSYVTGSALVADGGWTLQ